MKQITKDDIWDTSECDLTCTFCGTSCQTKEPKCGALDTKYVPVSKLRAVLEELVETAPKCNAICVNKIMKVFVGVFDESKNGVSVSVSAKLERGDDENS